jgi:hypothetical protein
MRQKAFGVAAATAALAALAFGGSASAGHPGRCTASFERISATVDPSVDKNGDGWICTKLIGGPPGTTVHSDVDDNAQGQD